MPSPKKLEALEAQPIENKIARYVDAFVDSKEYYKAEAVRSALIESLEKESEYIVLSTPAIVNFPSLSELEKIFEFMDANPKIGLLQPMSITSHPHLQPNQLKGASYKRVLFVQTNLAIIRRSALLEAGLPNERFTLGWGMDIEWSYRFRKFGHEVGITNLYEYTSNGHDAVYPQGQATYKIHADHIMKTVLSEMFPSKDILLGEFKGQINVDYFFPDEKKK